jgi:hypothetical protein
MLRTGALLGVVVAALAVTASAGAQAENIVIPFNDVVDVCGDDVQLSGNVLGTFVFTENGNGGLTIVTKFNPQGLTGTSLSTGARYHGVGVTKFTTVLAPGVTSDTYVNRFFIIGEAGAPNSLFSETAHITVFADGRVTASVDKASEVCLG